MGHVQCFRTRDYPVSMMYHLSTQGFSSLVAIMLGFSGAVLFRRDQLSQDVPRYFIKSKIILDLMAYSHPVQLGEDNPV